MKVGDVVRGIPGKYAPTFSLDQDMVITEIKEGGNGWSDREDANMVYFNNNNNGYYWWRFELVDSPLEAKTKIKQGDTVRIIKWSGKYPVVKDVEVGMIGKVMSVGSGGCRVSYAYKDDVATSFEDLEVLE